MKRDQNQNAYQRPTRLTELRPHPEQYRYWMSPARFNIVPAGRRSGKTEIAKRRVIRAAMYAHRHLPWKANFFLAAPTRDQAQRLFWDDVKAMLPNKFVTNISKSQLVFELFNKASIYIIGLDKPERMEGSPWDGGVVDEIGNIKASAWSQNIRPALDDRRAWCDLIGVPEGRNHYFEIYESAVEHIRQYGKQWGAYSWISADILPTDVIAQAKADMDELSYQQEYEASFVNYGGAAYYTFNRAVNCRPVKQFYNRNQPLIFCFDFNVEPGVCAVLQEIPQTELKDKFSDIKLPDSMITCIIGEVWISINSNTERVCNRLIKDWGKEEGTDHQGEIHVFGDYTGGARGTAKLKGSDWSIIKGMLSNYFGTKAYKEFLRPNPPERARVNAVNSRIKSLNGNIRVLVDMDSAPHVVKDFEGVTTLEGGSGEIDKGTSKEKKTLTHVSDAIGYYINYKYPLKKRHATSQQV